MRNSDTSVQSAAFQERHYTTEELAAQWSLSHDTIRRLFEREPGVLVLNGLNGLCRKRPYRTLRIPESVAARVYRRLQNPVRN